MGNCFGGAVGAPANLIDDTNGDERAYHERFLEDKEILGEGEFGVVKLVHDVQASSQDNQNQNQNQNNSSSQTMMACKVLRKGVVFKDNTLYSPLKPEVLRGEIAMLRKLAGRCYCLRLNAIYETKSCLYVITEYCAGGEMMEYLGNHLQDGDLRTEDVSRIAYQMLSAVDHCFKHHIIHRDIKPENVMFESPQPGAAIRLIDFGSGTLDDGSNNTRNENKTSSSETKSTDKDTSTSKVKTNNNTKDNLVWHKTFAGSAFYISPEMFQRTYTALTDVWSVGATLYVLVAGYPADNLQAAFNLLQKADANRDLRQLPGLPDNMPDSYYDLLKAALTYFHKQRPTAGELLQYEFVTFHKHHDTTLTLQDVSNAAASKTDAAIVNNNTDSTTNNNKTTTTSVQIQGSVVRHTMFLGFKQFERAVTALLATVLTKTELAQLLEILASRGSSSENNNKNDENNKLSVCKVSELKTILRDNLKNDQVLEAMSKIPNAELYDNFAYHTALLNDFGGGSDHNVVGLSASLGQRRSTFGRSLQRGNSFTSGSRSRKEDGSVRSLGSMRRGGGGRNSIQVLFSKNNNGNDTLESK